MLDQESFEAGLKVGLLTARQVLSSTDRLMVARIEIEGLIEEIKDVQKRRSGHREMSEADIFMPRRLASPADFGLPDTDLDAWQVALSKMTWEPGGKAETPTP